MGFRSDIGRIFACGIFVVNFLILLVMGWFTVRMLYVDQFVIPTNSMCPTLQPGDHAIVDKSIAGARIYKDLHFDPKGITLQSWRTRGRRPIRHNDILVFNYPHHDGHINFVINNVYCKRCLALPGDTIWSENGYYRNNNYREILGLEEEQRRFASSPDSLLPPEILATFPYDEHYHYTTKNLAHIYVPRLGDVVEVNPMIATYYKMPLEWETGKEITWDWDKNEVYADGEPIERHIFTHDYYFMAGDNVMNSSDSRNWGLVPEEYIVGVVTYITYSRNRDTKKLNMNRIWKKIACKNGQIS